MKHSPPSVPLGCIADDFTGATDLANNLVRGGLRVLQTIGVPKRPIADEVDAIVVALKSRTIPAREAVAQSLEALQWLQSQGMRQIYFKYCSTFDSTPGGNIGPVTDALMDALGTDLTIACPAFPEAGRTVFKGHLFVGNVLLHESGMRDHPLTPMTDSNLVRVLQRQTLRKVGLVEHGSVRGGPDAVRRRLAELRNEGEEIAIVDAITHEDLMALGPSLADLPLVTAGSGVAVGLVQNFAVTPDAVDTLPRATGTCAIVSGSCSTTTNAQVDHFKRGGHAAFAVDPLAFADGHQVVQDALAWATPRLKDGPVLIYATSKPEEVRSVQQRLGVDEAGHLVEEALSAIARGLVHRGVGRLVVAGGETSGACVQALGVEMMRIGAQISPGVPWCHAHSPEASPAGLHIALKSGNFGQEDFFTRAFQRLA